MFPRSKKMAFLVTGVVLAAAALYQFRDRGNAVAQSGLRGSGTEFRSSQGQGYGNRSYTQATSQTFEQRFWAWLKDAQYKNWAPMPGKNGDFYAGNSPHGAFVKLYMNRTACSDPKNFPHGSILIKENYGPDKKMLMAVTVMYRVKGYDPKNNDWYWAKYEADGRVSQMKGMPIAGKVMMCAKCHGDAGGKDYVFANDK